MTNNENRPKQGLTPDQPIRLDFEDEPLFNVIKAIGAMTGRNFLIDAQAKQTQVTIITHSDIPADFALYLLEGILAANDLQMVESMDGNLYRITPVGAEGQEKIPLKIGPDKPPPEGYDSWSTHVVPVNYQQVGELQPLLQQMGSQNATINAYEPTNTLIITDVADGVRNIMRMLEQLDVPGYKAEIEIFTLEYTRAEQLAQQLQDVLLGQEGQAQQAQGGGGRAPARPQPPRGRPQVPGAGEGEVIGQREEVLRIVPNERLNSLIVEATPSYMERVRWLIDTLDQPTVVQTGNLHVYNLLNARAEDVAEALNQMLGGVTPRQGDEGGQGGGGGGGGPTADVQAFEKTVQITPYEKTNALLVVGAQEDYKLIRSIISQLDVPRRQVYVEAVIMDVRISDDFRLAVEGAALNEDDFFALSNVASLAQAITQGPLGLAGAGGAVGFLDGTTEINTPDGGVQTIPNVPLLIDMLETLTDTDILSQPGQTTVDNEEASIIVGQEVPFVTGSSTGLDQTATNRSIFNRIDREDVGIQLDVTPQISEGDYVNLDLTVEVSQTIQSDIGADVNLVGPTLQKSNVQTNVTIKDGVTGVIGGLISEETNSSRNQTPVLGDIPLLGWLFRNKSTGRSKRNLVVLVTPYIVKDSTDLTRFTDHKLQEFQEANIDVLFEKGIIRKVKKRQELRNEYRPSVGKTESLIGEQPGFSRGEMQ